MKPKLPSNIPLEFKPQSSTDDMQAPHPRPTFKVVAVGKFQYPSGKMGVHLTFKCPICRSTIRHGGEFGKPGAGDGHRTEHCGCWPRGYYIEEVPQV